LCKRFNIDIEKLPPNGLLAKRYDKYFKNKDLDNDKVKVALKMKKLLESDDISEEKLGNTIEIFKQLFIKINEKFNDKGVTNILINNTDSQENVIDSDSKDKEINQTDKPIVNSP